MELFKIVETILLIVIIIVLGLYINKCNKEHFYSGQSPTSTLCDSNKNNRRRPYHNQPDQEYNIHDSKHHYNKVPLNNN